ncbi:hypothetical protein [Vulcanisaeta sp. JCM 16161]|uniref:hypothetical protein n=1 Tax=Vulcanisaeta sp. JCM 16161 TaxID=1295372 RepID=UPI001FB5481F|nr:hypothetical protein [Vulcanisaeta sp. JCM 16161]
MIAPSPSAVDVVGESTALSAQSPTINGLNILVLIRQWLISSVGSQSMDVSMALEICWGRKVRGSNRLKCGEEVNDERVIEEVMRLISEFLDRVERHRAILLNESAIPFDNATNALNDWLRNIETRIGESNDDGITNLRRAMLDAGRRMLRLLKRARERWLKATSQSSRS